MVNNFYFSTFLLLTVLYLIYLVLSKCGPFIVNMVLENLEHVMTPDVFESGCVYLYQPRGGANCPSIDPDSIRIEAYLKFHKINHKSIYGAMPRPGRRTVPFIVYNGQNLSNPQVIMKFLEKEFNLKKQGFAGVVAAEQDAVEKTIDNNIGPALLYHRVIKNHDKLYEYLLRIMPFLIAKLAYFRIYYNVKRQLAKRWGTRAFSEHEIHKNLERDLKTLSELLGDKKYLFGEHPTFADFALFAHLIVSMRGFSCRQQPDDLLQKYPNLKVFANDILNDLYPKFRLTY